MAAHFGHGLLAERVCFEVRTVCQRPEVNAHEVGLAVEKHSEDLGSVSHDSGPLGLAVVGGAGNESRWTVGLNDQIAGHGLKVRVSHRGGVWVPDQIVESVDLQEVDCHLPFQIYVLAGAHRFAWERLVAMCAQISRRLDP